MTNNIPARLRDPGTFADLLAAAFPEGFGNMTPARLDFAAIERLPDDLVPDGPRYADVAWALPVRDPGAGSTHAVVLYRHRAGSDDDVRERMLRHAESLARALDRTARFGHPERPVQFLPVVGPVPDAEAESDAAHGPDAVDAEPHPYAAAFRHPATVAALLSDFILADGRARAGAPGLPAVPRLDLEGIARVPDDWVPPGERYADVVWSVPLRDDGGPGTGATHALVMLKCESRVRDDAGERMQRHKVALADALDARGALGHPARPSVAVPIVVYSGERRWDAPGAVRVTPDGLSRDDPETPAQN